MPSITASTMFAVGPWGEIGRSITISTAKGLFEWYGVQSALSLYARFPTFLDACGVFPNPEHHQHNFLKGLVKSVFA